MRINKVKEIIESYTDYTIKAIITPYENREYLLIKDKGNRFKPFRVDELPSYSDTGNHAPEILKEIYERMIKHIVSEYMDKDIDSKGSVRLTMKIQNDIGRKYEWLEAFKTRYEVQADVYRELINTKFGLKSDEK